MMEHKCLTDAQTHRRTDVDAVARFPPGEWRMPFDASVSLQLHELTELKGLGAKAPAECEPD